jgi:hypothetical protein
MATLRDDAFRRVCRARDLIHARSAEPLTLAELACPYGIEA